MTVIGSTSLDFQVFADAVSIPLCLLSRDGEVLALNRLAANLLGPENEPRAFIGRRLPELSAEPGVAETLLERWSRTNQSTPGLLTLLPNGREPVICRCSGTAIGAGGTAPSFILLECLPKDQHPGRFAALNKQLEELRTELAARAQLEAERTRLLEMEQLAREEAERAIVQKDEFLGMMSHELRTPITTIYGNAFLLRTSLDRLAPEDRTGALEDIFQEADRLRRIIENLLVLARLETSRSPAAEPLSLEDQLETIARDFRRGSPGREVVLSLQAGLPPMQLVPAYIEMIVANLLSNADKYSPAGTPIELRLFQTDSEVVVSVLDEGVGLQAEEAEAVFEPFFRSPRTQELAGGVGLGLSVCKRLVEAQGGRIQAFPRSGGGTDFSLFLPL